MGECEARTQGAPIAALLGRLRTTPRAAQRAPAAQRFILKRVVTAAIPLRLGHTAIVAVIFLPLTLIASIYGTNLDFSPTGWTLPGGFFVMLGSMAALTAGLVLYFRKRRWF